MDQVQKKVQDAVDKMVRDIDRERLRQMQYDAYRCAAGCYEDRPMYSAENAGQCTQHCTTGVQQAQNYMQQEISGLQNRIQRCAMDCQDKVRDKVGASPSEAEMASHRVELEKCVVKCADSTVDLLPAMLKRMKEVLGKKQIQ